MRKEETAVLFEQAFRAWRFGLIDMYKERPFSATEGKKWFSRIRKTEEVSRRIRWMFYGRGKS